MTAPVALHTIRADFRDELEAHRQEALDLVDALRPLLAVFILLARDFGPTSLQAAMRADYVLTRYESRHLPTDPDPVLEAIAA